MLCKKLLSVVIAGVMFLSFSTNAFAELFSISAGVPASFSFSESDKEVDGMPTGFLAHVNFPILVGVGYESYSVSIKDAVVDNKAVYTMYDVFYLFPIPVINITIGLGLGTAKIEGDSASSYESATATQYYGQIGFPILGVFDLHASFHTISATAKGKSGANDTDLGGSMMAVGVSFGF